MNQDDDDFSAAFNKSNDAVGASLIESAPPQTEEPTDGGNPDPEGSAALETPTPEPVATAPAAAPAPEDKPAPVASAPAAAPADEDNDPVKLRARLSTVQGLLRSTSDELKQLKAVPPAPAAPAPAPAAAPAEPTAEELEAEEILAELRDSAPTVYKAVSAMTKKAQAELERTFEDRVAKRVEEINGRVAPIEQRHQAQSDAEHFAEIAKAHPDWEAVVASPELMAWVVSQPTWTQQHFAKVAETGTPAQVVEVLNQYRAAHPASAAPAAPAPAAPAPSALDAKREAQKRALGTQPSRSAPVAPNGGVQKPTDFESAFDATASRSAPELT